jgi:hypothetical protein
MRQRSRFASVLVLATWSVACSSKSDNPPPANASSDLTCLTDLDTYCCSDAGPRTCIADFETAARCSSWPSGTSVEVYASPCKGLKAVRLKSTWSTFYVYDATSSALVSVSDNSATAGDPRDTTIGCGAGPATFAVPAECGAVWLGTSGASACSSGSAAATSYCAGH